MRSLCDVQSNEFEYILPKDKIARHPVSPRRSAKLLRVASTGELMHGSFEDLPQYLHEIKCDGLWANETKVLQARLYLRKPSGGRLEVFILEPVEGAVELALSACDKSHIFSIFLRPCSIAAALIKANTLVPG